MISRVGKRRKLITLIKCVVMLNIRKLFTLEYKEMKRGEYRFKIYL